MNVRKASETDSSVTVEWDPVENANGYLFTIDGSDKLSDGKRHFTFDIARTSVKFAKPQDGKPHAYGVVALGGIDHGSITIPEPPPPPPPPATGAKYFAADSPWNIPIPASPPLAPNSAAMMSALAGSGVPLGVNQGAWTPGLFFADASTPRTSVPLKNAWYADSVPIPAGFASSGDSDAHAIVDDKSTGRLYEFYGLQKTATGWYASGMIVAHADGSGWWDGNYSANGVTGPWGCRASSASLMGGLILPEDVAAGDIPHALSCSLRKNLIGPPVSPATTGDGVYTGIIPMGSHLQLDPAFDLSQHEPGDQMIGRCLKKYGVYIVESSNPDTGSMAFYARNFNSSLAGKNPYPGSWSNGLPDVWAKHMRVIAPPPRPVYDNRATFGQPHK